MKPFRPTVNPAECLMLFLGEGMQVVAPTRDAARALVGFVRELKKAGYEDCTMWKKQPKWLREMWEAGAELREAAQFTCFLCGSHQYSLVIEPQELIRIDCGECGAEHFRRSNEQWLPRETSPGWFVGK